VRPNWFKIHPVAKIIYCSRRSQPVPESLESRPYSVLKFCTGDYVNKEAAQHQQEIYKRISSTNSSHDCLPYVQTMVDSFEVIGPNGTHSCLVFEPMRETLSLFQSRLKDKRFTLELLKIYLVCVLNGLDYLHSECRIVHSGELRVAFSDEITELT